MSDIISVNEVDSMEIKMTFLLAFPFFFLVFSSPKSMDLCSLCTWACSPLWCYMGMKQWRRLWLIMGRSLLAEEASQYLKKLIRALVSNYACSYEGCSVSVESENWNEGRDFFLMYRMDLSVVSTHQISLLFLQYFSSALPFFHFNFLKNCLFLFYIPIPVPTSPFLLLPPPSPLSQPRPLLREWRFPMGSQQV